MRRFISQLLVTAIFLSVFKFSAHADALDNWTSGQFYNSQDFVLTGCAYGNGQFVAVGQVIQDDNGVVETSDDGTNWVMSTTFDYSVLDLYDVTYANGEYVASGWDSGNGNNLYNSTDGIHWAPFNTKIDNFYRVIYAKGLFVAVGDGVLWSGTGSTNKNIYTSPDGINWTARNSGAPANDVDVLYDVAYGAGKFVAIGETVGSQTSYFHTSTTGTTWSRTASPYLLADNSISFCNGLFIAPYGPGSNFESTDGMTWSVVTNNTSVTFGRVIYTNGLYITFTSPGFLYTTNAAIFTSTDGTNWVQRNFPGPANGVLADIVFGNSKVVTVGSETDFPSPNGPTAFISDPLVSLGINSGDPPQLEISGVSNLVYGIQYSTALNPPNWQTATNFTLSNSPSIWTDETTTNSQRFYRAGLLP